MFYFYSTLKRPKIIYHPQKDYKADGKTEEGIRLSFEEKFFKTANEEYAKFIRQLPNFNTEYFEVDEETKLPKDVGYSGSKIGIQKMDSAKEKEINGNAELQGLKDQISQLTKLVGSLLEEKVEKANEINEVDGEQGEKKIDKRSKEYKDSLKEKE